MVSQKYIVTNHNTWTDLPRSSTAFRKSFSSMAACTAFVYKQQMPLCTYIVSSIQCHMVYERMATLSWAEWLATQWSGKLLVHLEMKWVGPIVFRKKFCQIPRTSLQDSAAYDGKIIQILWLATIFHLWVNWALYCSETSVIEGCHCVQLCTGPTILLYCDR